MEPTRSVRCATEGARFSARRGAGDPRPHVEAPPQTRPDPINHATIARSAGGVDEDLLAPFRACYLDNLAALYAADPALAARIDESPFATTPLLEPARAGAFTLRVFADDQHPVYVHSRYAPLKEAAALLDAARPPGEAAEAAAGGQSDPASTSTSAVHANPSAKAQATPTVQPSASAETSPADEDLEHSVFLICGCGLGYVIAEIERRHRAPLLFVAEQDLGLLKAALCVTDLKEPLRAGRLHFLTTADKAALHERLNPFTTPLMLGLRIISHPYTARVRAAFQAEIRAQLRDYVTYAKMQIFSLVKNARTTCRNIAFNLPSYLSRPGVEVLQERARGYPAILVAAGPSLARNIEQLQELQHRAVIIAVQTVYKTLLQRGIRPHFVTSLDYHEISAEFFRGIEQDSATILVAEPKANHQVLDTFRGPIHVLHSGFADELLHEAAPPRGALRAGSTVAHLSFYLAEHLGCDPLILVGQDLAFSEALYYPPGMPIERIWGPELNRFCTLEMKQWERIVRFRKILHTVTDIHDRPVYTDDQLYTYAEQFMTDFTNTRATVIHACEGGMRLSGTRVMTLRAAAEEFATRPLPADLLFESTPAGAAGGPRGDCGAAGFDRALTALEERLADVRELHALSDKMTALLTRLEECLHDPPAFNRLIARVDELRAGLARHEGTLQLVSRVSQLAELRRIQADRGLERRDAETAATARRQLRRDREFVRAYLDGCEFLERMLPEAIDRLKARMTCG